MPHKEKLKDRAIVLTKNKKIVLTILDKVLESNGLKKEGNAAAIVNLVPAPKERLDGLINRFVGKAEEAGLFEAGAHSRLLSNDVVELDDAGHRLFIEYIGDWIDAENEAGFTSEHMESFQIKSMRILIMEIFIRIVLQTLRTDSKLPPTADRTIWIDVLQNFTEGLKDDKYQLKIEKNFDLQIEKIHNRWMPWLRSAVSRISDIEQAKKTITSNIEYMKALNDQIMRYLVVAILHRNGVKELPRGSLSEWQINKTFKRCLESKLKEWDEKKHALLEENTLAMVTLRPTENKITKIDNYNEDLEQLEVLSREDIKNQNKIYEISKDQNIALLFGFLNWTKAIIGMLNRVDRVINLGSWVPILMNLMDFAELDMLIEDHKKVFDKLIDPNRDDYNIEGTKLRIELGKYNIKTTGFDVKTLPKLNMLQSKELLIRIRDELNDSILGIISLGKILKCSVMNPNMIEDYRIKKPSNQQQEMQVSETEDTKSISSEVSTRDGDAIGYREIRGLLSASTSTLYSGSRVMIKPRSPDKIRKDLNETGKEIERLLVVCSNIQNANNKSSL